MKNCIPCQTWLLLGSKRRWGKSRGNFFLEKAPALTSVDMMCVCDVSNDEDTQVYAKETMNWGIKTWEGKKQQCKVEGGKVSSK